MYRELKKIAITSGEVANQMNRRKIKMFITTKEKYRYPTNQNVHNISYI